MLHEIIHKNEVEDYAQELHCSGSCGISGNVHITYQCGELSTPDYKNRAYREKSNIKKFNGWRIFDEIDAYDMAKYLNMLVSDTALIYLNTINYKENSLHGDFTANVAKYKVASSVSTNNDKMSIKYICAYDLN